MTGEYTGQADSPHEMAEVGGAHHETIRFEDLFDLREIQLLQDEFSTATGVASLITHTDGTPITRPSNFCTLCSEIIRKTELGYANCCKSDAALGILCADGPIVEICLSGGLWDAGAGIAVNGQHIASWLIGQVRDETQSDAQMLEYARAIGADEQVFLAAFKKVPAMSREQFDKIAKVLFTLARQLSTLAYQNALQAGVITERKRLARELEQYAGKLEQAVESRTQELYAANQELTAMNEQMAAMNQELTSMNEELFAMNESLEDANRALAAEVETRQQKEQAVLLRDKQYRATASLITSPGEDVHGLLEAVLQEAIALVGAPGGHISLLDESGRNFVVRHAVGANQGMYLAVQPVNQGMLGEVHRSGEMLCVEDYRRYRHRIDEDKFDRLTTGLMAPLKLAGAVKGVLVANWQYDVHPITTDDIENFRQFGILASIVLERAHAGGQINYHNQLLQKLAETTAFLVNELDMGKALQNILEQATVLMGIPNGFIQLLEQGGTDAVFQCGIGRYENQVGKRMHPDEGGILSKVLRTGKLVFINDYANWPERIRSPFTDGIMTAMQAPINVDGKTIGSIGLTVFDEPLAIDTAKIAIFEQFATISAIAVKNALAHQKANHLAFHDTLTGLPNRAHLNRRLEEELKRARCGEAVGAVLFIDLDDLKTVNDHFGHTCGDGVIVAAGEDIVGAAGEGAFVARVGGDEFIIILSGKESLGNIAKTADRLVGSIRREYEIGGRSIHMSTSVGITLYPQDGDKGEEILQQADIAMYSAKAAGKNCWRFFEPWMLKENYDRLIVTNSLRRALERGELYLHYQPQITLPDRRVVGFEALLRWNSKEHGQMLPDRFIPLAEQSGLILPIGQWVIEEACRFGRKLADLGRTDLPVAVNVSPRQLAADDFVWIVRRSIGEAGINPQQLEVEITENVLIDSMEDSTRKLGELSALGVRLSLDDFGTGFSSLTYLRNLPVETLKIDKTFIDRIEEDTVQEGFVRSIIEMAHVLALNVVAEGVETEQQLAKLSAFGCDCVQGYVFSRPVSPEEAIRFSTR